MQHQRGADLSAKMFRIGSDGQQRFRSHIKQQSIDRRLVGIGKSTDFCRQGEHDVVILDGQQVGLPGFKPALCSTRLTLRAMPVAAGVVADLLVSAGIATQYVSSQRRGTALFDGRHHLELAEVQMTGLLLAPCGTMGAKDVCDLQGWPRHGGTMRSSASPEG
jgi:hypothetical protein